ncbi:hypothetical protein BHM03_00036446 [Ensete ventricosum]|nr:hypothetical protein BHM03_00036446 [Ensete ventricosum]
MVSSLLLRPPPPSAACLRHVATTSPGPLLWRPVGVPTRVSLLRESKWLPLLWSGEKRRHLSNTITNSVTACFYNANDKLKPTSSGDDEVFSVTAVVLGVIYGITNTFQPLPDDVFRYGGFLRWICKMMLSNDYDGILLDLKEPFDLRDGWLLWAGVGLLGALIAIALIGFALNIFSGENPHREVRYCLWSFVVK